MFYVVTVSLSVIPDWYHSVFCGTKYRSMNIQTKVLGDNAMKGIYLISITTISNPNIGFHHSLDERFNCACEWKNFGYFRWCFGAESLLHFSHLDCKMLHL